MDISLIFRGPFLFEALKNEPDAKNRGIYIWGFKYPDENKFIPYYVGKASSKSIVKRIEEHREKIESTDSTYTRLSESFMKSFYFDVKTKHLLPTSLSRIKSKEVSPPWFNYFQNKIDYLNARWFIIEKNSPNKASIDKAKDYPMSTLIEPTNDFLVKNLDNLLICYAIPEVKNENLCNDFYEYLESITKITLKGWTFGKKEKDVQSNEFTLNNCDYSVSIKNMNDIQNDLYYLFKDGFSEDFPGNY